jgi:hypothetical protein
MVSHLLFSHLALCVLVWLFVMLHLMWSKRGVSSPPVSVKPKHPRATEPKAIEGLTQKPHCTLCERETPHPQAPPAVPLDPMAPRNRRPRTVDTSQHCCPHPGCR